VVHETSDDCYRHLVPDRRGLIPTAEVSQSSDVSWRMRVARLFALDLLVVIAFVLIGRRNHGEDGTVDGFFRVAAPFLLALAGAWVSGRKRWASAAHWRYGVVIWVFTVGMGLLLRRVVFHNGTAIAFVIVATLFLGLGLVGWRVVSNMIARKRVASS
jgi:FtsH-binding integral membrane protein